ncbi:ABC transporter permease [Aquicella lusitana]|uniref:ABC-2 type transport system permease protein n=1 Tax=Aquicella lusitana TaxID=254246 RepID=A0A370GUI8_9COXI|nr:ABC transporter permease [Aquicella lusitana]RDI46906.1 ABC-2 type transport system permease protein [Aquicella lusitana]VVC73797.1 Inner membrane transport permease YbhR [Aquicella lusitana]
MIRQLSLFRLWGLIIKEFIQFKRDHSTFAMVISLPVVQLILFGLAINTNPRDLPSALINFDRGPFSRSLVYGLENTKYFKFDHFPKSEAEATRLIERHQVLFTLTIPSDFSRKLVRGEYPAALLEVDGTDPVSVGSAVSAATGVMATVFQYDLVGPLDGLNAKPGAAELRIHTKYNPSAITQYNIVPGLLGTVLTMTFVMVASMALTRERERGTMESLLSTPIRPVEVIVGKATPFIIVGYLQVVIVIFLAVWFFKIPLLGSELTLLVVTLPFILANLFVGIMISTLAKTQLEASQISMFFFLPSLLLSGFAFPFKGMPFWAQWIGNVLPLTHFINIVRGIMLKGIGFADIWVDLWPIILFMLVMLLIALKRYRRTLD